MVYIQCEYEYEGQGSVVLRKTYHMLYIDVFYLQCEYGGVL